MIKRTDKILLLLSALVLVTAPVRAGEKTFSYGGYYKNFLTAEVPSRYQDTALSAETVFADRNLLRLSAAYDSGGIVSFNGAYNFAPRIQDLSGFAVSQDPLAANDYRIRDLNSLFYHPSGSFGIYQNLDRAYARLKYPAADIYLGRQAISWGSARVINPTDILVPFRIDELDKEERSGVDAVRMRIPTGPLGEYDLGGVFGKNGNASHSSYYLRRKINVYNTDISVLLVDFRENALGGLDLARSLGGAGVWLETAYSMSSLRASLGGDYSFNENTYAFVEYHFNGAGSANTDDYDSLAAKTAYSKGAVYLLGRQYLIPGIAYQLTPLAGLSAQTMVNLNDGSVFISVLLDYNLADNYYLALGIFSSEGKSHSEFGNYSGLYYTSLRYYF